MQLAHELWLFPEAAAIFMRYTGTNKVQNSANGQIGSEHLVCVTHICVTKLLQHCFKQWFVAYSVPSFCLNSCWFAVNWDLVNNLLWNLNENTTMLIQKVKLKISSANVHHSAVASVIWSMMSWYNAYKTKYMWEISLWDVGVVYTE